MKIGDKVRFLNEVGGGTVAGFQGKDIVIVQDADGFDIPVLMSECVVIETNHLNIEKKPSAPSPSAPTYGQAPAKPAAPSASVAPDEKPITFKPRPVERRGGDALNIFIAFTAMDAEAAGGAEFEAYLINDSNYEMCFALHAHENGSCTLLHSGVAEPNTKLFLQELQRADLGQWERVSLQAFFYKERASFLPKPALDVNLRIEGAKFYRPGTFRQCDFFTTPALLFSVICDDRPVNTAFADTDSLRRALMTKGDVPTPVSRPVKGAKPAKNAIVEVDLHAAELLDTTAGMQPRDILQHQLDVFRRTMDEHSRDLGRKIVFIHGKGDGVLRSALLKELRTAYKHCQHQDASFREYGFGATMVTIGRKNR